MATNYGAGLYGAGAYGGRDDPFQIAGDIAVSVTVFDNTGARKGFYQTGSGEFLGCEFTIDGSGGRDFILFFANFVDIEKKDLVQITLFNSDDIFFKGVVRKIPIDGSTKLEFNYSGFGMNDYLLRANTESRSYSAKTINFIVEDLLDNVITVKTPITKNALKLDALTTTVTSIAFNYSSCNEALSQLKALAQSDGNEYNVGVDADGDFFFKARNTETLVTLVAGKKGRYGIERYEPKDSAEQRSKYFVLDKDGVYVTTVTTSEDIDIYEGKLTAPDIDNADIANWATGILTETEIVTRTATIEWQIETETPLVLIGDGNIRIISNIPNPTRVQSSPVAWGGGTWGGGLWGGGEVYGGKDIDDTLKVEQVKYIINSSQAKRVIQLGSLPEQLTQDILNIRKDLTALRVSLGR